jgi:hypothetical protein
LDGFSSLLSRFTWKRFNCIEWNQRRKKTCKSEANVMSSLRYKDIMILITRRAQIEIGYEIFKWNLSCSFAKSYFVSKHSKKSNVPSSSLSWPTWFRTRKFKFYESSYAWGTRFHDARRVSHYTVHFHTCILILMLLQSLEVSFCILMH